MIDQRLSMWTSLTGLCATILATLVAVPYAFVFYIYWMFLTRYIIVLSFLLSRPSVSAAYPFFLYYNQIVGSFVKIYVLFRLDKQKWTRQNTTIKTDRSYWSELKTSVGSLAMHVFSFFIFVSTLALLSGVLDPLYVKFWINV